MMGKMLKICFCSIDQYSINEGEREGGGREEGGREGGGERERKRESNCVCTSIGELMNASIYCN